MSYKAGIILCLLFGITGRFDAAPVISHPRVIIKGLPQVICTSQLSYYIDHSQRLEFNNVQNKTFSTQTDGLPKAIDKYLQQANYWIKFSLKNTNSGPVVTYMEPGYFGTIQVYEITREKISLKTGGASLKKNHDKPYAEFYTIKLVLPPQTTVQYILRLSSTLYYDLGLKQVNIFSKKSLYEAHYHDYYETKTFRFLQILFLGFMFSQMLYVGFSLIIGIKRKEYLFYLFYLALVTIYYMFRYNNIIGIYGPLDYYPQIRLYTKSILLALPYLFYIKFIRYFLNIRELDEKASGKLIGLEYFTGIYVLADTTLRFLLPVSAVFNEILMITIFAIFIYGLTIIIPFIRYKKILVNLILAGSLAAGLGGVAGILITLFQIDLGILHTNLNSMISGQIGIVVETIIFTASLSLKTRMMEREKIENQKKLIAQLEENQLLREKMRISKLEKEKAAHEEFSKRLIQSQENERKRIASELHDSLGQNLLIIKNRAVMGMRAKANNTQGEQLKQISLAATSAIDEVRRTSYNLHPYQLERLGLTKTLKSILSNIDNSSEVNFNESIDNIDGLFKKENEINIYRAIQECINNVIKHSDANNAVIEVKKNEGDIEINISDDGKGFDTNCIYADHDPAKGFGIKNISRRVNIINGSFNVNSSPGKGTKININIPFDT
jgi:signal transduction histidine kinase